MRRQIVPLVVHMQRKPLQKKNLQHTGYYTTVKYRAHTILNTTPSIGFPTMATLRGLSAMLGNTCVTVWDIESIETTVTAQLTCTLLFLPFSTGYFFLLALATENVTPNFVPSGGKTRCG